MINRVLVKATLVAALLLGTLDLAACKSLPGADGEYATHDRGALNRGP